MCIQPKPMKRLRELARRKKYREENAAEIKEYKRKWYLENRDHHRNKCKTYAKENRDKLITYRAKNKSHRAKIKREWNAKNKEKKIQYQAAWFEKTKNDHDRMDAYMKKRRVRGSNRRAKLRGAHGSSYTTSQHIDWRWQMFGGRCWMCGDKATATDHVKPIVKGGSNYPANLRPACCHCNSSKGAKWPYPTSTVAV